MLVTYNSPTRAHHYTYATALARAGHLQRFVSAFSRFSPRGALPELGDKLLRVDHLQNFYLASLRFGLPTPVSDRLFYWSRLWLDRCSQKDARQSDVFLFYGGAGLQTLRKLKRTPVVGVVEAVNSHVLVQRQIMQEESERLGLPLQGFPAYEVARRVEEYRQADGIICPSTFVRQSFLDQGFAPDRLRTVPFGVAVASRAPVDRPKNRFRVLYVGQINLRKGVRYLLEAFGKLKQPGKELWIVGPRTQQTGIDDVTLPEGVRFLGVLKGEALDEAYRSCDVFVLPTLEEGLALVIGEALSHGLPVIATINSGAMDIFEDGTTGFLVPIRSPGTLTDKLQLLADDRALLQEMSNRAVAPGHGLQTWERAGEQLAKALKDFAGMPKLEENAGLLP